MAVNVSEFGNQDISIHLARWKPILTTWGKLMDQYQQGTDGDSAYAYNERASVGMLALAIREANGNNIVLEEYRCDKRIVDDDGDSPSPGRADMWAKISGDSYTLEAKFRWVSCQNPKPWLVVVRTVLAGAMTQVQQYDECTDWFVGAVFVVPYLSKTNDMAMAEVRKAIKAETPALGAHSGIRADYYPAFDDENQFEKEQRFPGVSLFLAFRKK